MKLEAVIVVEYYNLIWYVEVSFEIRVLSRLIDSVYSEVQHQVSLSIPRRLCRVPTVCHGSLCLHVSCQGILNVLFTYTKLPAHSHTQMAGSAGQQFKRHLIAIVFF